MICVQRLALILKMYKKRRSKITMSVCRNGGGLDLMLESQACRTMGECNVKHIHGLDLYTEKHLVDYLELNV